MVILFCFFFTSESSSFTGYTETNLWFTSIHSELSWNQLVSREQFQVGECSNFLLILDFSLCKLQSIQKHLLHESFWNLTWMDMMFLYIMMFDQHKVNILQGSLLFTRDCFVVCQLALFILSINVIESKICKKYLLW